MADGEVTSVVSDANGASPKEEKKEKRTGSRGGRGGARGRGTFKGRSDSDDLREKDPCGVFLFFPSVITADIASELLRVGKIATEIRLGKMCYMNFATEDEATKKKKELSDMDFDGVKPHIDSAFKQRDSNKQNSNEETEAAPSKNKEREKDPCGIFIFFKNIITSSPAAKLLVVGKSATQIRFGRMCHMNFATEDEAEEIKKQLMEMEFDGLKPHVDSAYKHRSRDGVKQEKRVVDDDIEESHTNKKTKEDEKGENEDENNKEEIEENEDTNNDAVSE
ncbi:hypothetical protein OTU49_003156 [Cherax quadricarinatus]|uniref:RRM domain-containing protein n=1 Tax=Cherax quadricarinatus TaxID=27406 RepID=A0AAW0X554_CHEQU|nr:uncharacterized protein LOC128695190 [Cherax quadricarinatus]XP_053641666.1 uncharacterized protein LOC128695190 [Cherax quadricarinatus]